VRKRKTYNKLLRKEKGHLDRLQNKYTNCKGVKNNSNFEQITGIQEKLVQHVNRMPRNRLPRVMETVLCYWQKESWQTFEEASGHVRPERVNKWPNCMKDR
jgi:rubrerythrin